MGNLRGIPYILFIRAYFLDIDQIIAKYIFIMFSEGEKQSENNSSQYLFCQLFGYVESGRL